MKKKLPDGSYRLRLHAYGGMSYDLVERGTMAECRQQAASRIRYHRNKLDYPVSIMETGSEWELQTGDDAAMIGDGEGTLWISELTDRCHECRENVNVDFIGDGLCDSCREMFDNSDYEPMSAADADALDYLD